MPSLSDTIILATRAHATQVDRIGQPYILHVLRVMLAVHSDEERQVALLHDVVEDGHATLEELRGLGYSERIVAAVDAISRRKNSGETYAEFIERVGHNPLAARVKLADLADNFGRLHTLPDQQDAAALRRRYEDARQALEGRSNPPGA